MKKPRMRTVVFLASFVMVLTLVGSIATGGIVFLDDFEDGSATDGAPVTWTPLPGYDGTFFSGLIDDVRIYNRAVQP